MVQLSPVAVTKVKEILSQQTPAPVGLRVAVVGGGCSGFSYNMAFENAVNEASDNVYEFDGLKVLVDQMSTESRSTTSRRLKAPGSSSTTRT
jgi:iron-sulfur cluster assembly accessory protein